MIDLHTHSTASDGTYSPIELIERAAEQDISVLALTDHDTFSGLLQAAEAAKKHNITFVPGIEINIDWTQGEFHLLGLGIDSIDQSLVLLTEHLQADRLKRNERIIQKMHDDGLNVSFESIKNETQSECIGRPHIADYLVKQRIAKTRQQAFDVFLAKGRPYFIGRKGADLDTAIEAVKKSGGVPVLAHPLSLYASWGKMEAILASLKERGIEGLEAWHPGAREVDCNRLEKLAKELGFFVTAGSDFHGEKVRADRKLGRTSGNLKINERFWENELKPHLKK